MQENQKISENPRPSVAKKHPNWGGRRLGGACPERPDAIGAAEGARPSAPPAKPSWGGKRAGAGAPKGNLNAFKHGRTSRRQAQLLEAALDIPEVRQTLIDLANRERCRRKKAEEGYGVLMTHLLERVAEIALTDENNRGQNNQEFLDFLNTATAEMRKLLEKPSRRRRIPIKQPSNVAERLQASTPLTRASGDLSAAVEGPGVRDKQTAPPGGGAV